MMVAVCGAALLIAAAVVVVLRDRRQSALPPEVSVAQTPAEVRVKAAEKKAVTLDLSNAEAALKFLKPALRRS